MPGTTEAQIAPSMRHGKPAKAKSPDSQEANSSSVVWTLVIRRQLAIHEDPFHSPKTVWVLPTSMASKFTDLVLH